MAHYFQPTNFRPRPRQARKPGVLRVSPLLHDFPFSVPSYGARNTVHGPRSFSQFPFSFSNFHLFPFSDTLFQVPYPATPLFATLTKTAGVCTDNSQNGTFRFLPERETGRFHRIVGDAPPSFRTGQADFSLAVRSCEGSACAERNLSSSYSFPAPSRRGGKRRAEGYWLLRRGKGRREIPHVRSE